MKLDDQTEVETFINKESMKKLFESMSLNDTSTNDKKAENPTDLEIFQDTYFQRRDYHYYSSIYNFLTGGSAFDKKALFEEWKKFFDDRVRVEEPQYTLYQSLNLVDCLNFSNKELKEKTRALLNYALEGKYTLDLYLSVYWYIERFNPILKFNMERVARQLVTALERHKTNFLYVPMLSHNFGIEKEREFYKEYRMIFDKALEVNKNVEEDKKQEKQSNYYLTFIENPQAFYEDVLQNSVASTVFSCWNLNKTFNHLKKMKPK